MDDVIFARKPRLLDVAVQLKGSAHAPWAWLYKLCAVIPVANQRTHETTFRALKITSLVATTGAESAVYDCLVSFAQAMRRSQPEVINTQQLPRP